ncbi:MAG TPA: hypothetical protein VMU64_01750 [Acidimicrobiales bacterium]|nr:hypothetical protein [Acidimicrobiales bacterium]
MRNKNRMLLGVLALTIPLATVATLGQPAFAKKPPPNPVTCGFAATVTLTPALTAKGTPSSKGAEGTAAAHATYSGCTTATGSPGPFHQNITILFKAAKDKNWKSDGNSKKTFYLGLCGSFASTATVKDLAKAVKNLPFQGGVLKGAKAAEGTVGPDVGFTVSGTVKGGTYPTASKSASIKAGLTNDANNSNLISGCQSGPVNHIDIDSSASTVTL